MANQKTRKNRKARGLPPNVPVKRVRWHTDTQNYVRQPSEDPDFLEVRSLLAILGKLRKPPKPMVHSMGAFNNAVLTSVVPSDVVSRMRTIFIRVPGCCEGCIAARKWYMDEGVHVERINYKSCSFCESSD